MKFVSTRGNSPAVSFEKAIFAGIAPDGGLYVPENLPDVTSTRCHHIKDTSLSEIALTLLKPFVHEEIPEDELEAILTQGLSFPLPIVRVGDKYILELFHGPTMAFKDVAAQILPRFMQYFLKKHNRNITIITATSGDTGGAVAHGFGGIEGINVVILFPKGKVSGLQYEQLTRVAPNIISLEVEGTFDDCQRIVKEAFRDEDLKKLNLTSANSINIGRLLPQMVYYAYACSKLSQDNLRFVIPSGNMGNATAGLYAKKSGIAMDSFLIACNTNDPVVKYVESGKYMPQMPVATLSTAMDIGDPSNFERMRNLYQNDLNAMRQGIDAVSVSGKDTIGTIQRVYKTYHYLLDPHTAVAWCASEKRKAHNKDVIIATAHPAKFAEEILLSTGISVPKKDLQIPYTKNVTLVQPDIHSVKTAISEKIRR